MRTAAHLWAIGYDDQARADQVRETISELGWETSDVAKYLILLDIAVVVRHPDGSFTFDRKPFAGVANILGCTAVGFLAGLALAAPSPVPPSAPSWAAWGPPRRLHMQESVPTSSARLRRS